MSTLLDLDGTLLDHDTASVAAARVFHRTYLTKLEGNFESFLQRWGGIGSRYSSPEVPALRPDTAERRLRIRDIFGEDLSDIEADKYFATYYDAYLENWSLFPDALACLGRAARQGAVGVITNGTSETQRAKLDRTRISGCFTLVLISCEVGVAKPDRRIFDLAVNELGPDRLYVGDSFESDVLGALSAGIAPVWLQRVPLDREVPDGVRVIHNLAEL